MMNFHSKEVNFHILNYSFTYIEVFFKFWLQKEY